MKYRYTAYKNGTLVAWADKQKELAKMIGTTQSRISDAVLSGQKIHDEYKIVREEVGSKVNPRGIPEIYREWDEVVKPFKNVKWVKKGGRKLEIR